MRWCSFDLWSESAGPGNQQLLKNRQRLRERQERLAVSHKSDDSRNDGPPQKSLLLEEREHQDSPGSEQHGNERMSYDKMQRDGSVLRWDVLKNTNKGLFCLQIQHLECFLALAV